MCNFLWNTDESASAACWPRRGWRPAKPAQQRQSLFLKASKAEEVLSKTQFKLRSFSKFLRCFSHVSASAACVPRRGERPAKRRTAETKTNSLMNCHHHNHQHLAQVFHTPSKERGRKQFFRSEYFVRCEISILNVFPFQVSNLNEM